MLLLSNSLTSSTHTNTVDTNTTDNVFYNSVTHTGGDVHLCTVVTADQLSPLSLKGPRAAGGGGREAEGCIWGVFASYSLGQMGADYWEQS